MAVLILVTCPMSTQILCTDWGDAKQLKWCPTPFDIPRPANGTWLGLLAGVWADGAVRVVTVIVPDSPNGQSKSLAYQGNRLLRKATRHNLYLSGLD